MLIKLRKRRGEYPTGAVIDLPKDEAESLVAFGLAEAMPEINAEAPRSRVERAKVENGMETATVETETLSVAEIAEDKA